MKLIFFLSNIIIPIIVLIILICALKEKKEIFDIFLEGVKEGIKITYNVFPTLLGLFVAIGALRYSGILDIIIGFIIPICKWLKIPSEIMPLAVLRPISGSASIAVATDIMKNYGVDSKIGRIAATIMGSTETTLYTIAIYTSCIKIKKTEHIIIAALCADIIGIVTSVIVCNFIF